MHSLLVFSLLQRDLPVTSPDVPSTRAERSLSAVAEISPWLYSEQGALQAISKGARAVSQLHSLWGQGTPFRNSSGVPGGLSVQNHGLHFLRDLPSQPSSVLPNSHDCSTAQGGKQGHCGGLFLTAGSWGGTAELEPCVQQCPGLLQAGRHSPLPTAELGGAGTGAEPAVLTQHSRNLICLIYSLGKKKINKWHLACPHVSLSQRRCQLNEPKPSA